MKKLIPVPRSAIARKRSIILAVDFLTSFHSMKVRMIRQLPKMEREDDNKVRKEAHCNIILHSSWWLISLLKHGEVTVRDAHFTQWQPTHYSTLCSKTRRKERKEFTQEKTLNCFKSQLEDKQAKCIMISDYLLHYCMGPLVDHLKTNFHSITRRSRLWWIHTLCVLSLHCWYSD